MQSLTSLDPKYIVHQGKRMEVIKLSHFQQNCASILENVTQTNRAIFISSHGKFIVKVLPVPPSEQNSWLGCMVGTGNILDDVIKPTNDKLFSVKPSDS